MLRNYCEQRVLCISFYRNVGADVIGHIPRFSYVTRYPWKSIFAKGAACDMLWWCFAGKVMCAGCGGKCSGEVLRVSEKYFHTACFTCRTCAASLAKGGFFAKDNHYYCPQVLLVQYPFTITYMIRITMWHRQRDIWSGLSN